MNKTLSIAACTAAFIGMGIAMPQCPGDKAAQDQMEGIRQQQQAMTTKLMTLDGQIRGAQADEAQSKQLITQLAAAVTAQKGAIDQLNTSLKELQARVETLSKRPAAAPAKAKKRHR